MGTDKRRDAYKKVKEDLKLVNKEYQE